jgi:hypothetical protein
MKLKEKKKKGGRRKEEEEEPAGASILRFSSFFTSSLCRNSGTAVQSRANSHCMMCNCHTNHRHPPHSSLSPYIGL